MTGLDSIPEQEAVPRMMTHDAYPELAAETFADMVAGIVASTSLDEFEAMAQLLDVLDRRNGSYTAAAASIEGFEL